MIPVCPVDDLPPGESHRLDLDPPISVFRTDDGALYALDDTCTHQDASLADGWIEDRAVECPLHASRFDLRTGAPDCLPAKLAVRTHEVLVLDGVIHVVPSAVPPHVSPGARLPGVR